MEEDKSPAAPAKDVERLAPLEFQDYLKDMDMKDIQPIQSTSPIHHARSAQQLFATSPVSPVHHATRIYRARSAEQLYIASNDADNISTSQSSIELNRSLNTSLEDFKAKARLKGKVALPNKCHINIEEDLKAKKLLILKLQQENEELRENIGKSYDGQHKEDFINQVETISKLKLECVLKQNEVDRLKTVETTLKQTKQVLKDTTWALTVKEEELRGVKTDMRDNYEKRLSELILRLNDRELKLASIKNERDSLNDSNRDVTLRVDELSQQLICYREEIDAKNKEINSYKEEIDAKNKQLHCYQFEIDAKNKQFEMKETEIKALKSERDQISIDSSAQIELLVEKLHEIERKVEENASLATHDSQLDGTIAAPPYDNVGLPLSIDIDYNPDNNPDANTMSLEQITLMIQDNAHLRQMVEENKERLVAFRDSSERDQKELQQEVADKGDQISELVQLVNTMRSQIPSMEIFATSGNDDEQEHDDDALSNTSDVSDVSEDTTCMKQQMSHTISNYEQRINELQRLYDQDVFSLEHEKEKLQKEIKELQSNFLNVSQSNVSFASEIEDLKSSYEDKITGMKVHYEDMLHKECVSAEQQQAALMAENSNLQFIVEEAEKKFMQHLDDIKENYNLNYHTDITSEIQKVFATQTTTVSAIKDDLRRELDDIKSIHSEGLCTVEQEFGLRGVNQSGLEDTYSNEILKLTEERNAAEKESNALKDELDVVQEEYDSLKALYDSQFLEVDQYKNEKLKMLSEVSLLSEEYSNLKHSLVAKMTEVEEYQVKLNEADETIKEYTKVLPTNNEGKGAEKVEMFDIDIQNSSKFFRIHYPRELLQQISNESPGILSPQVSMDQTFEIQRKSNLLHEHIRHLRCNLDEAKCEVASLQSEHGCATLVFDNLSNSLNILKTLLENDREDLLDIPGKNTNVLKLVSSSIFSNKKHKELGNDFIFEEGEDFEASSCRDKVQVIEDAEVTSPSSNTFEISENLILDAADLSDADNSDEGNDYFTKEDFEKELSNFKIGIPFDYCEEDVCKGKEKSNTEHVPKKPEIEILELQKENKLLQEKIESMEREVDVNILSSDGAANTQQQNQSSSFLLPGFNINILHDENQLNTFRESQLDALKILLENVVAFEGNDVSGFKRAERSDVTEKILNNMKSRVHSLKHEANAMEVSAGVVPTFSSAAVCESTEPKDTSMESMLSKCVFFVPGFSSTDMQGSTLKTVEESSPSAHFSEEDTSNQKRTKFSPIFSCVSPELHENSRHTLRDDMSFEMEPAEVTLSVCTHSEGEDSTACTKHSREITELRQTNEDLKEKILHLERDIFNHNLNSTAMDDLSCTAEPPASAVVERVATKSMEKLFDVEDGMLDVNNISMQVFNMQKEVASLKIKFCEQEKELLVPGLSSVALFDSDSDNHISGVTNLESSSTTPRESLEFDDNEELQVQAGSALPRGVLSRGVLPGFSSQLLYDEQIERDDTWDSSLLEQELTVLPTNKESRGKHDCESAKQLKSLSKSFTELGEENESLKKENNSLKEEAERDSRTLIGPGFSSEILYYEHAQPLGEGDSVGIKVDAIKTLLSNVVISEGSKNVSFEEYEGRDVILRLLLDIQVEVVDLIKENLVLKEETDKQVKPVSNSCVQTGDSLLDDIPYEDGERRSSVKSDTSSLAEQELLEAEVLSKPVHFVVEKDGKHTDDRQKGESGFSSTILDDQVIDGMFETDEINKDQQEEGMMFERDLHEGNLLPDFTSTGKLESKESNASCSSKKDDVEIVNLLHEDAHILVKTKENQRKFMVPAFSSVMLSSCYTQSDENIPSHIHTEGDRDTPNQNTVDGMLERASKSLVNEVLSKAVSDTKQNQQNLQNANDKLQDENEKLKEAARTLPGFSSEILKIFSECIPSAGTASTLSDKMSAVKTVLQHTNTFQQSKDTAKHKQNNFTSNFFKELESDVFELQKENTALKHSMGKLKLRVQFSSNVSQEDDLDKSLELGDLVEGSEQADSVASSVAMVPGFNSDGLLCEQLLSSAVDNAVGDDMLDMLIENLIIFEGSEEGGFKTSEGNEMTKSFLRQCQGEVRKIKKENTELKLQVTQDDDVTSAEGRNSFIVPGFIGDVLFSEDTPFPCDTVNLSGCNLTSMLENVVIFEGNEAAGYSKSEENDGAKKLLSDFKTKIGDLLSENDSLKGKIEKMQLICASGTDTEGVSTEEISIAAPSYMKLHSVNTSHMLQEEDSLKTWVIYEGEDSAGSAASQTSDLVRENNALKVKLEKLQNSVHLLGCSREMLHTKDILPFSEVDSITHKLNALNTLLDSIVVFTGDNIGGYRISNDQGDNIDMQSLMDFKSVIVALQEENSTVKHENDTLRKINSEDQLLFIPGFSSEALGTLGTQQNYADSLDGEDMTVVEDSILQEEDVQDVKSSNPLFVNGILTKPTSMVEEESRRGIGGVHKTPTFVPGFSSKMLDAEHASRTLRVGLQPPRRERTFIKSPQHKRKGLLPTNFSSQFSVHSDGDARSRQHVESKLLHDDMERCVHGPYINGSKEELIELLQKKDKVLDDLIGEHSRENTLTEHDGSVMLEYEESIRRSKAWMEAVNLQSLSQLREDLDEDYLERIKVVEEKLQELYRLRIKKVADNCGIEISQMKRNYDKEILKLQHSPDFLEETEASLGSYKEGFDDSHAGTYTLDKSNDKSHDTKADIMSEDETDFPVESDAVSKATTTKSGLSRVPFLGIEHHEQQGIVNLKESIVALFRRAESKDENSSILFHLDDVASVLHENYNKIADMTDKLRVRLHEVERDLVDNFNKEKEELVVNTKKSVLNDLASIVTQIVSKNMLCIDTEVENLLVQHKEDVCLVSEAIELSAIEESDMPEKLVTRMEDFELKLQELYRSRIKKVADACGIEILQVMKDNEETLKCSPAVTYIPDHKSNKLKDMKFDEMLQEKDFSLEVLSRPTKSKVKSDAHMLHHPWEMEEQQEIVKLKESIVALFRRAESKEDHASILFHLDDVAGILHENYYKIDDMTNKLRERLYAIEREMIHNFNKEKEELVVGTKENLLNDIASIVAEIVTGNMVCIDNQVQLLLLQHEEDLCLISKAIELNGKEKGDIPEKLPSRMEDFLHSEDNILQVLKNNLSSASASVQGSDLWKRFFHGDHTTNNTEDEARKGKKKEFKSSIEKSLNSWSDFINRSTAKIFGQVSEYYNLKMKHKTMQMDLKGVDDVQIKVIADAHTNMVLRTSIAKMKSKDTIPVIQTDISSKVGEFLLKEIDTGKLSELESQFQSLTEMLNSQFSDEMSNFEITDDSSRVMRTKMECEMDDVIKSCVSNSLQALLKKDECFGQVDDGKRVRFLKVQSSESSCDDAVQQHTIQQKQFQELRRKMEDELERKVKSATDYKLNEFEEAKMDLVKQHQLILDEFIEEQEKEIQSIRKEHDVEMENVRSGYVDQIYKLQKSHEISQGQASKDSCDANAKEEYIKTQFEEQMQALREQHTNDLFKQSEAIRSQFEEEHIENMNCLQRQIEDDHEEHLRLLSECQQKQIIEIHGLKNQQNHLVQQLNLEHAQEIEKLQKEISDLQHQCNVITATLEEDKHAIDGLRNLKQVDDEDSTVLAGVSQPHHFLSTSIMNCYQGIQKNVREQHNSQIDTIMDVFDSVLHNVSSKMSLNTDGSGSDTSLREREAALQSVQDLVRSASAVKPNIHQQIGHLFKDLQTDYENWYADVNVEAESQKREITQLKEENISLLQEIETASATHDNAIQASEEMEKACAESETKLQRIQRQEGESSNFISILQNDIKKITAERDALKEDTTLLKQHLKDIVDKTLEALETMQQKMDEVIDNQLSGLDLSQYGLDTSLQGKSAESLLEMTINAAVHEPQYDDPEFLKGVSSRLSETVDHFLQVLALIFADFKNTSLQQAELTESMEILETTIDAETNEEIKEVVERQQIQINELEEKLKKPMATAEEKDRLIKNLENEKQALCVKLQRAQTTLQEKLQREADLEMCVEQQYAMVTSLEENLGKNKQILVENKKLKYEKGNDLQHISDLEKKGETQDLEIRNIERSLQEKLKREAELEKSIEGQHLTISQLEEKDKSNKELNQSLENEKISDKHHICDLENEKEIQDLEIRNLKNSLQERLNRGTELETFIQEHLITISELEEQNNSNREINQNLENEKVSDKQNICNLENEKEIQDLEIRNLKNSLQERLNRGTELETFIQEHLITISGLEEQNNSNKEIIWNLENEKVSDKQNIYDLENERENLHLQIRNLSNSLQEKLNREDELETFIEEQNTSMSELEEENNSNKEINKSVETENTFHKQHICDLEYKKEIQEAEIKNLKLTLQETLNREIELDTFIEKQHVTISALEEQDEHIKKTNENLENENAANKQQLFDLEKTCSEQTQTISANEITLQDQMVEIEALRSSMESQQFAIKEVKEQLIKNQMLMDAKECQLIEMEEQLKKETQRHLSELEDVSGVHDSFEKSLDESSKENSELKTFLHSKQLLISELEEQLADRQLLIESKEKQLDEMNQQSAKQKERYELELKQLSTDKSKEITAIYNELEGKLKEKDLVEDLVKKQESSIAKLKEQMSDYDTMYASKEKKMLENEEQLKQDIEKLVSNLETVSSANTRALEDSALEKGMLEEEVTKHEREIEKLQEEVKQCKLVVDEKYLELEAMDQKLVEEKEKSAHDLENMTLEKDKEVYKMQLRIDEIKTEKSCLEDVVSKQQSDMNELQERLKGKQTEIDEWDEKLTKQKEKHALDLKKLSGDKGKEITAIFNELEEKLKEKDLLEDLVKKQETSILKLKEQLNKYNELNDNKDVRMGEREDQLKKEIENLQADLKEMDNRLERTKLLENTILAKERDIGKLEEDLRRSQVTLDKKQTQFAEVQDQLITYKEKMALDLEILTSTKNEELTNTQQCLDELSSQKEELEGLVELKQAYIIELEEQLKESNNMVDTKQSLLADMEDQLVKAEEDHASDLENSTNKADELNSSIQSVLEDSSKERESLKDVIKQRDADVERLETQLKEHKEEIDEKHTQLIALEQKLVDALKKHSIDIARLSTEKTEQIVAIQNELNTRITEKEQLACENEMHKDTIVKLKGRSGEVERQHEEEKAKLQVDTQFVLDENLKEKDHLEDLISQQQTTIDELGEQLKESKLLVDEWKNQSFAVKEQLTQEKEEHALLIQEISDDQKEKEKEHLIAVEEISKEKFQMEDVLKKQQVYIGELEEQLIKSKDFLEEKQTQLNKIEEEFLKEKQRIAVDFEMISNQTENSLHEQIKENNELNDSITNQKTIASNLEEEVSEQKAKCETQQTKITELEEMVAGKQAVIGEKDAVIGMKDVVIGQKDVVIGEKDAELKELKSKKDDCLSEIGNLIAEKKQAVTTIHKKDETISTMQDAISNMENTMSTLENTIQENSKERGTLEMSIINQQSLMAQLEEELSKHRVLVECKETEFGKVELVKKEKEEQVSKLLNESAEMKEILETLQQCLDEKVQQGAALSEMMENEKSLNADLEKQVNEKSEEVTALKQQVEKENISHLADLEQISLVKDEMIETIQSTLKEQMAEKCEFQNVIDNQLAVIVGLEEQLSAQKKLNDEKFGMLETREQLLKTKDKRILDLQKEIEEDAKKISNVQETMQKQIEEGEKKRNVLDESLQQKLIKEAELNEHIITLQTQIEHVEKKVNEQETLLAEKNNQLNVSQEEIERISLGKEADIANIQGELQAHSNESSHLKTIVEKQQMQIADMENEFETQRSQSERMIMELTDETKELKEKSDILEKTIEQKVIQEADCDDLIQKQKTLISELEKQVEELQHLFSAANEELQMVKQQMGDEKEQYTTETQKFSSEKQQEVEGLQHELEEKSSENEQMRRQILTQKNSFQANNQHFVESEAQLKKECEEVKKKLAKCEKTIQEKLQEAEDQQELLKIQKSFIAQSEKKVQEYQTSLKAKIDELADAKQLLSKERNQHMLDFENVSSKQKETISNMEKVLEEEINEKKELKAYIESQEALAEELKKQLNEHKIQIASKENMLADMRSHHAKALEKRNIDFEQAASEKMESISCMERKLEEEVRKKDELADFLKNQQLHIDDLENEVSGNKMAMCEQEEQLNGNKEMLAALEEQLNENKVTMAQQDHQLMEIKGEHAKTLEKHECDFNNATIEHRREMSVLEKNVSDQVKECDELRDIVKRQQALVCELDEQLNQQKTSVLIKEKELSELKECLAEKNDIASKISELKKEVADKQTKITSMENNLQERSRELQDANDAMMKQQIKQTELEEQLNEHNVMLHAKNHEFIETKETLFKESAQQCEKWEWEKEVLQNNLKKVEEKVKKVEEDLSKKTDELCALQKAHNEVKLQHINEMMKLNNDHRSQVATLMEIPQKDRNIKVLLMDLQKEADEVLNLVLHHDDINEDTPPERIETLKATWNQEKEMLLSIIDDMRKNAKESTITEMSAVSAHNLSSEDVSEIANEPATLNSESSLTSLPSDKRTDMEQSKGRNKSHHVNKSFDKQNNQQKQRQDAILHENSSGIVSEFEKLLNDESAKVEGLNAKLEEQMRLKESMQMSHEVELAKVVERELNLKEKYLKVAELLQKEKNAKTRIMEMLNDAQRLNDIQGQNLEEVQNDKNSLLESYNIVSELEHLLSKEKEKADLANTKLEKEKYEKLSIQASFEDKRAELKATKERESTLREKCRELNGLLEKENEDKRTIADTLENERKMIVMEKKNLEQKESSLNQTLAKLVDNNVDERFKSLKSWEDELKKREKTLLTKDEKLKSLMKGIEQGYDILPERQGKDSMPEKSEKSDDSDNDWLKQIQSNQLVDRKHLPLVADLNQKIKSLQKDKVKLAETLTDLKNEIIDYRKQLKDYQLLDEDNRKKLEDKESRLTELASTLQQPHDAVQQDGKTQTFTSDGQKLLNAGWTIAKVQRLYLKYFRAESFRKALVYQKRYLTLMVNENDQQSNIGNAIAWPKVAKRKVSFKVAVLAVISIRRMKYLVKKYHRNLHKSSPDYQYKDKPRNAKKKNSEHAIDEFDASPITNKVGIADNQSTTTYKAEVPEQQFPSTTRSNSTRQPQHSASILPQKTNPRHSYYSPPKHTQYTPATNEFNRLNTSEPINRLNINNELINNTVDILPNNHHVSIHDASTVMWPNEAAPRSDNMWSNEAAPRSYPRPSGLNNAEDISPSRGLARVHGELNSSRVSDKGSLTNRVFEPVSPPSPLLSSTTRDVHEPDANESLSSYIHTLETLQNRLKKVGYNDRARPSLL